MCKKLYAYKNKYPQLDKSVFVAPGAKIIGDVVIEKDCGIWFNTVVRGDVHSIRIGEATNIQDLCMLHVTNNQYPLNIGKQVTVGHSVTLHGCTIGDKTLIGMGATVMDGAVVEEGAIVGAGCLVPPNFTVPAGKMAVGVPAKIVRDVKTEEIEEILKNNARYVTYAKETEYSLKETER